MKAYYNYIISDIRSVILLKTYGITIRDHTVNKVYVNYLGYLKGFKGRLNQIDFDK